MPAVLLQSDASSARKWRRWAGLVPSRIACLLLNVQFYLGLLLFTCLFIPLCTLVLALLRPFSTRRRHVRILRALIRIYGMVVIRVLPSPWVRVVYEQETPLAASKPCIFVCTHRSSSDPFLMACLPVPELVQVVNTWPMHLPVWGSIARLSGYLGVNELPAERFLDLAETRLRDGACVVLFPEGHRSPTLDLLPFHSSAFHLAQRSGFALVPICISGSERTPPKGSLIMQPGVVRMKQLAPVLPADWAGMNPARLKAHVRAIMERAVHEMDIADRAS